MIHKSHQQQISKELLLFTNCKKVPRCINSSLTANIWKWLDTIKSNISWIVTFLTVIKTLTHFQISLSVLMRICLVRFWRHFGKVPRSDDYQSFGKGPVRKSISKTHAEKRNFWARSSTKYSCRVWTCAENSKKPENSITLKNT